MSYADPYLDWYENEAAAERNYVLKHWYGDFSLQRSWWINGTLLTLLLLIGLSLAGKALLGLTGSLQAASAFGMFAAILGLLVYVWWLVGTWRSAGKNAQRGGSRVWTVLARIVMILGLFGNVAQLVKTSTIFAETAKLAIGMDELGEPAHLALIGEAIHVDGPIALGTAGEFDRLLSAHGSVKRIVLNSTGGRTYEASKIAERIRTSGIDTLVKGTCTSACTYAFLAGRHRYLAQGAQIGFHQPSLPGAGGAEAASLVEEQEVYYRKEGLDDEFIQKVSQTPSNSMWYPDLDTLAAYRIFDRVEPATIRAEFRKLEEETRPRLPAAIDAYTRLVRVRADGTAMRYDYDMTVDLGALDVAGFSQSMASSIRSRGCASALVRVTIASGASYVHRYRDRRQRLVTTVTLDKCAEPDPPQTALGQAGSPRPAPKPAAS